MVKYLVMPALEGLNASLQRINFGDHSICGQLNCYSLKMVQKDKKLVKHLQREYSNEKMVQHHINRNRNVNPKELDHSLQKLVHVSVGNLHEFSTIRLISYFISTLNTTYTDFDFTSSEPSQFELESPQTINETINARLAPLAKSKPLLMESFWKHINTVMDLNHCQFYSFIPSDDVLSVLRPHSLWNIDYFVVNIKKKQLLYLSLFAQNNLFEHNKKLKVDMELDELENVDDGMQWCDAKDMSPKHDKQTSNDIAMKDNEKNVKKAAELQVIYQINVDAMPLLERPSDLL